MPLAFPFILECSLSLPIQVNHACPPSGNKRGLLIKREQDKPQISVVTEALLIRNKSIYSDVLGSIYEVGLTLPSGPVCGSCWESP